MTDQQAPAVVATSMGQRSLLALVAGLLMVVGGVLFGLAGLAVAVIGPAVIDSFGDLGAIPGIEGIDAATLASGVMTFVGLLILFYSIVYLVGGIGVIRSREWGRVLGILVGILSGLLWLGSVATPDPGGVQSSIVGSLVLLGIHAYIVVALLFFWKGRAARA